MTKYRFGIVLLIGLSTMLMGTRKSMIGSASKDAKRAFSQLATSLKNFLEEAKAAANSDSASMRLIRDQSYCQFGRDTTLVAGDLALAARDDDLDNREEIENIDAFMKESLSALKALSNPNASDDSDAPDPEQVARLVSVLGYGITMSVAKNMFLDPTDGTVDSEALGRFLTGQTEGLSLIHI